MPPTREPYDDRTFLEKHGLKVLAGAVVLIGGVVALVFYFFGGKVPPPHKPEEIAVHLLPPPPLPPPPPPPPPPKTPPPPKEQKMVELKPQDKTPPKPENHTPSPPAAPGPKASGPPSDEGIGGGGGTGGDGIGGDGGGSVFGYYAGQVGDQAQRALSSDPRTRNAKFHVKGRVFFDSSGRVTRAALSASSDDPAVDAAIKDVLANLQLPAPPQGMPPSILMNLEAHRPN
jgi:hypothetical protein